MAVVVTAALVLPANLTHPAAFVDELEPWIVAIYVQGADQSAYQDYQIEFQAFVAAAAGLEDYFAGLAASAAVAAAAAASQKSCFVVQSTDLIAWLQHWVVVL